MAGRCPLESHVIHTGNGGQLRSALVGWNTEGGSADRFAMRRIALTGIRPTVSRQEIGDRDRPARPARHERFTLFYNTVLKII